MYFQVLYTHILYSCIFLNSTIAEKLVCTEEIRWKFVWWILDECNIYFPIKITKLEHLFKAFFSAKCSSGRIPLFVGNVMVSILCLLIMFCTNTLNFDRRHYKVHETVHFIYQISAHTRIFIRMTGIKVKSTLTLCNQYWQ